MSIASKLTKSVRQAKETGANTTASVNADELKQSSSSAEPPAAKAQQGKTAPRVSKRVESEGAIIRFPSRRVWPD